MLLHFALQSLNQMIFIFASCVQDAAKTFTSQGWYILPKPEHSYETSLKVVFIVYCYVMNLQNNLKFKYHV